MEIISDITPTRNLLNQYRRKGLSIGLVPTMGALHAGHRALIEKCKAENDITVVSLFVNPTQFNNQEDFDNYPNKIENDTALLQEMKVEVLFKPTKEIMYPGKSILNLDFGYLEEVMEGKHRPGHFKGVGMVVAKLLNIINPDVSYFGQKDFQQTVVIRQLVNDLNIGTKLQIVPTVREPSGLALSSRNLRLSEKGREEASAIFGGLNAAANQLKGGSTAAKAVDYGVSIIKKSPEVNLEYLEIVDRMTLLPIDGTWQANDVVLCAAAYVEGIRLIDNIMLEGKNEY